MKPHIPFKTHDDVFKMTIHELTRRFSQNIQNVLKIENNLIEGRLFLSVLTLDSVLHNFTSINSLVKG